MMLAMRRDAEDDEAEGARVIPISERALFERHRRGERGAFAQLVSALRARVFGYLTRCGVPVVERDDLFQEVFLRVHRASTVQAAVEGDGELEPAPATGPLVPWVLTITVNVVRSHFRKVGVRAIVSHVGSAGEDVASAERSPESALSTKQSTAWLEAAVLALPLEQREAIVLCAVDGLEVAEAARVLGAPLDTIKTRLRRARLALAEARARQTLVHQREESR